MKRLMEILLRLKPGKLEGADRLIPTFAADYNNWIILGLAVLFLGLVALTVLSYLREGRTSRRVKLTLAGIRIVIIFLLFALLFQPGLILRKKNDLYSTVAVVFDDSLSMSLKDRYAEADLRRAVADALGMSDEALRQIDRAEVVRRALSGPEGPLARLGRDHRLMLLRFPMSRRGSDDYTERLLDLEAAADRAAERFGAQLTEVLQSKLDARGHQTNLAAALRDAARQVEGRRVAAIVLVSDGQVTSSGGEGADRLRAALAHLRQRNIPVVAVAVGDPEPPQNVAVLRLQGPGEVRQGSDIELTAYLAQRNCGGESVRVGLSRRPRGKKAWEDLAVTRTVELDRAAETGRTREQEVVLRHEADKLGEFEYRVRVEPLEQEFSAADNVARARVRITDQKLKVLLVSGDGGWEYQGLRNLLLTSPHRYGVSVWQQNAEKEFNQEASSGMRLTRLPRQRKELYEYEVVVLYDPAFTREGFDGEFAAMLEDFVGDHHGGLCYIAGNKYTDMNLVGADAFKPLADLLPVVLERRDLAIADRISRGEASPWVVLPTAVGLDHPVLRLADEAARNLEVWKVLPGVYWSHPVYELKPVASDLAVSSDPVRRLTGKGEDSGRAAPVIAVQYYGKGRVLYLGSDETWRWRALEDGTYYRRFWSNAMDFLASGRLQQKRVIVTTGSDRFAVGDEMRVRVEAYGPDYRPLPDERFKVRMVDLARPNEPGETFELKRDPRKKVQGHYEGMIRLKEIGNFELTAADEKLPEDAVAGKAIAVTLPQEEFRHPEADPDTMRTVAREGAFIDVHEADRLPDLVPAGKLTVYQDKTQDLWDVPLTLAILVPLLGLEWVLRKKHNMA